jgi:cytoskeletal protein RodZ
MAFNNTSELPDSQIEYRDNEGGGRRLVTLLIYIVLALVVATLVVFAGRWVYHKFSNNSAPAPTTVSPKSTNQGIKTPTPVPSPTSKAPGTATAPPATPPSSSSSSGAKKSSGSSTAPTTTTPTPAPTPTSLPNNGPGEIIALFIGSSFAAGFLHFTVKLRKIAKDA